MNKNLLRFLLVSFVLTASNNLFAQTVHVTNFTVSAKEKKVILDWKTDGTTPTNYFAIQKSTDGINYRTIALVLGPDPKQNNCDCYGCYDNNLPKKSQNAYYRLIHVNADGTEEIAQTKVFAKA